MSIKSKNKKKTNLLTRIIKDKKGLYVSTAMKIVLSIVLGITTLTGSVLVVKDMVMPRTSEKIAEAFDNDYSSGASGGGSGGGSTTTRNGTVPEGCTYTSAGVSCTEMPFAPAEGDVYKEGDYVYTYGYYNGTLTWNAQTVDRTKSSYGIILSKIAGKPVTTMYSTFEECGSLTTAPTIPDGVTNMDSTFRGCSSLTTAPTIPDGVTNMESTFRGCSSLTTAPTIPDNVTNMDHTFSGCTSLTTAPTIPDGVTDMGNTFSKCTGLTTAPVIPDSVTTMSCTFNGCTGLTTAPTIPNSVTNMSNTFDGCTGLTTAPTIPNGVTNMKNTFYGCTSLTSAPVIPGSVTNMNRTFEECTTLTGSLECNANPKYYNECLKGTQITSITGSCSQATKDALLATK